MARITRQFLRNRTNSSTASAARGARETCSAGRASRPCPIGRPVCARCGMPTAFETSVCDECKDVDFGFESARAPLKYTGVGKEIVHVLKYRGYTRVSSRDWPRR